jgi:hypothetical protein
MMPQIVQCKFQIHIGKLCSRNSIQNVIKILFFQQITDNTLIYLKTYNDDAY